MIAKLDAAKKLETKELLIAALAIGFVTCIAHVPYGMVTDGAVLAFVLRYCRNAGTSR